jgi:hypothetical protein
MSASSAAVTGMPRLLLRLEGVALCAAATWLYARTGLSWWLYAILFLVPDISFAGYLAGERVGAAVYNVAHTTAPPLVLAFAALWLEQPLALGIALIWLAHVGIDRALGYGLKYDEGFGFTHLGRVGRASGGG